jgi:protein-S-isoprenylcysteine O-methyltransferase Ste14
MNIVLLCVALGAAAIESLLLAISMVRPDFEFWPPPGNRSWQKKVFFGLFRVFCGATILVALFDWGSMGWDHWTRLVPGLPLLVLGAWITVRGYLYLGLDNTYGERGGLVTGGLYRYSRNPQYVASVAATLGLGLVTNSWLALLLTGILFALYLLFALNEERWLKGGYGRAFLDYMERVPRFLDQRTLRRVLARF